MLRSNNADSPSTREPLRTLDAVHLASALEVRDGIGAFLAYDRRLCAAAGEAGLDVQSPGA